MRAQFENSIQAIPAFIVLISVLACGGVPSNRNSTPPPPNTPGIINGTLYLNILGASAPTECTAQAITWTASSTAGSTQTKTSAPISDSDNILSVCDTFTGGDGHPVTLCSCPVTMSFISLAPGNWNVTAGGVSCSAQVKPGQTSTVQIFTDGRPCIKFP